MKLWVVVMWKTFFLFSNTWSTANQGDDSEQMNMVAVFMCSFGMDGGNSSEPLTSHVNSGANDTAPYSYLEKKDQFCCCTHHQYTDSDTFFKTVWGHFRQGRPATFYDLICGWIEK